MFYEVVDQEWESNDEPAAIRFLEGIKSRSSQGLDYRSALNVLDIIGLQPLSVWIISYRAN